MTFQLALRAISVAVAAALAASAAQAQNAPSITTPPAVLPQVQQLGAPPAPPTTDLGVLPASPAAPRELARPADDVRIDVTRYEADGGPPALHAALAALTAPYTGPGRSYEDLVSAAVAVTQYLQSTLGYYLGYAYLPEQRAGGGVVRIAVLEGRLDRVVVEWPEGIAVQREVVEAYLARLQPGAVLTVRDVERVVFLVNDLRGLNARFQFREGRAWGTAELLVSVSADERWTNRVDIDSDGSRYSGVERLGAQFALNSPFGRGDGLTLGALASFSGGLAFALAGYTLPVGDDGWKVGGSLSAFRYRFDRDLLPQGVEGEAAAANLYALYPLVRSRNLNAFAIGSFEHKRFADRQGGLDEVEVRKHSDELRLAWSGDLRDDTLTGGVNTYEVSVNVGRVAFDRNAPAYSDDDASFRKLGYAFTRLQNLASGRVLAYVSLRGQWALSNLDSTQQYRLGGADGVRAFAPGELAGDSGVIVSLELRWLPPTEWLGDIARELVLSAFYDAGRIRYRHDASLRGENFDNSAGLAGAGIGLVWERPRNFNARLFLAEPTRGTPTGDPVKRHPRVYALFSKKL